MIHFFFFNDTATTEIYTLSLHDALPICYRDDPEFVEELDALSQDFVGRPTPLMFAERLTRKWGGDRKSTRLNSSHANISYAVFCLKKKSSHANISYAVFFFNTKNTFYYS